MFFFQAALRIYFLDFFWEQAIHLLQKKSFLVPSLRLRLSLTVTDYLPPKPSKMFVDPY